MLCENEKKFTHQCPVIRIDKMLPADNSDQLAVVKLFDGATQVVVNKNMWKEGELAVYIQPQSVVDTAVEQFAFLKKEGSTSNKVLVRACKLRGNFSDGLLIKVPDSVTANVGDDLSNVLGVERYVEALNEDIKEVAGLNLSKYDIDSGFKMRVGFRDGEPVFVEEKINGENARVYWDSESKLFRVGTRNNWIGRSENSTHWIAFDSLSPLTLEMLEHNPHYVLYGEAAGRIKWFNYGCEKGKARFFAFDIWDNREKRFLDVGTRNYIFDVCETLRPPSLGVHAHNYDELKKLAAGNSKVPNACNMLEGVVVRPLYERSVKSGRLIYKIVSDTFNANFV